MPSSASAPALAARTRHSCSLAGWSCGDLGRGGERGEQVAVLRVESVAQQVQLTAGSFAKRLTQQRVLVQPPGEAVLGEAHDEHRVAVFHGRAQ